ncbi:hypothetical protein ACGFX8_33910 [Streptomyces sp. NPDC048362]|uniref:hypothetical protein n=1 Tax=Streptomyces sp. NPDC048362 TaxID=3365539 RepID=UPI003714E49F
MYWALNQHRQAEGQAVVAQGVKQAKQWEDFDWVVWKLEVQDPKQLAGEDPDLDERTQETMKQLAASLGCVYELSVDYDSYDSGTPYYAWWVRLPAAEHARRDKGTACRWPSLRSVSTWTARCRTAWSGRSSRTGS